MHRTYLPLITIYCVATLLSACGASLASRFSAFTEKGFPLVAGTYQVSTSDCSFTALEQQLIITQVDADLSVSASAMIEAQTNTKATHGAYSGPAMEMRPPQTAPAAASNTVPAQQEATEECHIVEANVDAAGLLTARIEHDGTDFSCDGDSTAEDFYLSCTDGENTCSFVADKTVTSTGMTATVDATIEHHSTIQMSGSLF